MINSPIFSIQLGLTARAANGVYNKGVINLVDCG